MHLSQIKDDTIYIIWIIIHLHYEYVKPILDINTELDVSHRLFHCYLFIDDNDFVLNSITLETDNVSLSVQICSQVYWYNN